MERRPRAGDSTDPSSLGWDQRGYPVVKHDRDIAVPLTLRLSRAISSADNDPVCRCVCVVFCLLGDNGVALLYARFSFPSPELQDFLCEPMDGWHVS